MIAQWIYLGVLAVALAAAMHLQRSRSPQQGCGPFCLFFALQLGIVWEAVDCWLYGPPGFPSSRWLLMPAVAVIGAWTAVEEWLERKRKA